MTPDERTSRERALRQAVLGGDEDAWRALYDRGFGPLLTFVRRRSGGDEHRVEEVLQEVWMAAVRRLRRFDPDRGPFEAWVLGIARNVLRNRWRADRREETGPADPAGLTAPTADPGADLERVELVTLAMAALPGRYRTVLRAKYGDGLSVRQIAERTLQTPKTVESLLTRARNAFRRAYRSLEPEERDA
jgi:RNA polymerase sigma-70 factor (ECF subfamily)